MPFQPIGKILTQLIKKKGLNRQIEAVLVIDKFHEIIKDIWGEDISEQAKALHLKDKKLTIACLSSVAAQEIRLHESEILEKLNKEFGDGMVEKLRYQL